MMEQSGNLLPCKIKKCFTDKKQHIVAESYSLQAGTA